MQYCFWHSALPRYALVPPCWFWGARRKGERLPAIPVWDVSRGRGVWDSTGEPLRAGEKRNVLVVYFSHPASFELTLSCSMWEVTEISLWCMVSWLKCVCCLHSALHTSWSDCSTGRGMWQQQQQRVVYCACFFWLEIMRCGKGVCLRTGVVLFLNSLSCHHFFVQCFFFSTRRR